MQDLGTLGGITSYALGINDAGQVVGYSTTSSGEEHAFLYSGGVMQDLGTLGGTWSRARSINDVGQVVGTSDTSSGQFHAFLYSSGIMQDLGTLGGFTSGANSINNAGQVVGISLISISSAYNRAFLYSGGIMQDLGTLGGDQSQALGINDAGQVVGDSDPYGIIRHAFLYSAGIMQDLGTLGGDDSIGLDINDSGQVVGRSTTSSGEEHAFLYPAPEPTGTTLNLGQPSETIVGVLNGKLRIPIILKNSPGIGISATSNDVIFDNTVLANPVAELSATSTAAGKDLLFNYFTTVDPTRLRIGVVGFNQTTLPDGPVAYLTFDIISIPSTEGKTTELLNYPSASTPDGTEAPVTGSNGFAKIINYWGDCDANDLVAIFEVQSTINMHLAVQEVQGCADPNGDNAVTIDEVQFIINNYLGILTVPPVNLRTLSLTEEVTASAAPTRPTRQPAVTLGSVSGKPGSLISVPVSLKTMGQEISSLSMDILFDANILESPQAAVGVAAEAADKNIASNVLDNGKFRVAVVGLNTNVFADGVVANLTFRIKSGVKAKQTVLTVEPSGSSPEALALSLNGGSGTVKIVTTKR